MISEMDREKDQSPASCRLAPARSGWLNCVWLSALLALTACGNVDSTLELGSDPTADTVPDEVPDTGIDPELIESGEGPGVESDPETGPEVESDPEAEPQPEMPELLDPNSVFQPDVSDIVDSGEIYQADGYSNPDVIQISIRTATGDGPCTIDDQSGCTLEDVIADTNPNDDFKVDIPVHFAATDFPDDGLIANAELRQRGGGTRQAPQKSFRIKLDDKDALWRGERHLQLNKHPFESSRIRNKLAFDLMSEIPHLLSFRTQFANLTIDDGQGPVNYGLFTHVERGDERYLRRRGFDDEDRLYKANFFQFQYSDLQTLLIDSDGEPLNESVFETVLEIESGENHQNLIEMLQAMHDPQRDFQSVLDEYFNENNVLTWLTVNLLVGQYDATRHNYFLLNPKNSKKFYFVPWDYDTSFGDYVEPANDFSNEALSSRLKYGYATARNNVFISSFYRLPGAHARILEAADELRQNYLTDQNIAEKADLYTSLTESYASQQPDITFNESYRPAQGVEFANKVASSHESIRSSFSYPLPPLLDAPELTGGQWRFRWQPAYDLTGNTISYDLQLASSPDFEPASMLVEFTAIADQPDLVTHSVDASQVPPGTHYVRLVARVSSEPQRFWQIAGNTLQVNDTIYYGVAEFEAP